MKPSIWMLRSAAALMALALIVMLVCLTWFSALTMAIFLGVGLGAGGAGLLLFTYYVVQDLRRRGAL